MGGEEAPPWGEEVGECPKNGEKEQIHLQEGQITS